MNIDYRDIKEKQLCGGGYLWFLETFGKEKVELSKVIELAPANYASWLRDKFKEPPYSETNFKGVHAWRDKNGDIYEFHLNSSVCKAEKFRDVKEFPSGSFLPVENIIDTDRYVVIGAVKSNSFKDESEYLYFYDTEFATPPNILQLCINIRKIYWAHINLGIVFFDLPLYAHFSGDMCKSEKLENLIRHGKLIKY